MSNAGMIQVSLLSGDKRVWPRASDHTSEGLTDVGRLTSEQIDPPTAEWRRAQQEARKLVTDLKEHEGFRPSGTSENAVSILTVPCQRNEVATHIQGLGFSGSSTEIASKVIVGLAHLSAWLNDNAAATPESALQVLKAAKKGPRKAGWPVDMKPLESFLETATNQRQTARELRTACSRYIEKHGYADYIPDEIGTRGTDANDLLRIKEMASRLAPSSRIPLVDIHNPQSWQSPGAWKSYAACVRRLSNDDSTFHSQLERSAISKDHGLDPSSQFISSSPEEAELDAPYFELHDFMEKCDAYYAMDIGDEKTLHTA